MIIQKWVLVMTIHNSIISCHIWCLSTINVGWTSVLLNYERIVFNNSQLCLQLANRTTNFIVGLTNVAPSVSSPPVVGRYMECGRGPADIPCCNPNKTYYVKCADNQPPARYVIIQLNKTEYLNFCELEVYGQGIYTSVGKTQILTGFRFCMKKSC